MESLEPADNGVSEVKTLKKPLIRAWVHITKGQSDFIANYAVSNGHVSFSEALRAIIQDRINEEQAPL